MDSVSVLSWNARGLKIDKSSKRQELQNLINSSDNPIDILCIQETHIAEKMYRPKLQDSKRQLTKSEHMTNTAKAEGSVYISVKVFNITKK